MVNHENKKLSHTHVHRYQRPQSSKIGAPIPGAGNGIVGKQDIVIRKQAPLNANGNEVFHTIAVTHRAYDLLCYESFLSYATDRCYPCRRCQVTSSSQTERRKIYPLMLYAFQLFQRSSHFN